MSTGRAIARVRRRFGSQDIGNADRLEIGLALASGAEPSVVITAATPSALASRSARRHDLALNVEFLFKLLLPWGTRQFRSQTMQAD